MKILRTWIILRVRETRWPRGQQAPAFPVPTSMSAVVAVVGLPGSSGLQAETTLDLVGWYQLQKEL